MKSFICLIIMALGLNISYAQYSKYFKKGALRIDISHSGGMGTEGYKLLGTTQEPSWGGNPDNLIDTTHYGIQLIKILDYKTKKVIYSQSYNTLFNEWLDTPMARNSSGAYFESRQIPLPRKRVVVEIYSRATLPTDNSFTKMFSAVIDPKSSAEKDDNEIFRTYDIEINGKSSKCVDIVILGEGYSQSEEEQFVSDCKKFTDQILEISPYKERRAEFNVRGVWTPSKDSGVSSPAGGKLNTHFDGGFGTFGSDRYFMVENQTAVAKAAGNAPYDTVYILGNTDKYGGGGVYNFYAAGSVRNASSALVHIHEIGHSFVSLGDEYDYAGYESHYFTSEREPWEENLTTLKDFSKKRIWSSLMPKNKSIPTPKDGVTSIDDVGVYEGGGYVERGVYRPAINCIMRSVRGDVKFCPVCTEAINRIINQYTK